MNPLDGKLWDRGFTYEQYRRQVDKNGEGFDHVYQHPAFKAADLDILRRIPPVQLVIIGEDWCPDVWHTLPTWVRVAEEVDGWDYRIFERDKHLELMDHFLYRGTGRRVPVYAFYDENWFLQTWWSGRGAVAQRAVDEWLAGGTFADLEDDQRREIGERFDQGYRESFRRLNFLEILQQLRAFFHLG